MEKLIVYQNKTLKLTNACIRQINDDEMMDIDKIIIQMDNYLKSKGAIPIGPLIQCTDSKLGKDGLPDVRVFIIRQSNNFINTVEPPYSMQSLLRCRNCLFVRYTGLETYIKFAYDKLNLVSYEEDIKLTGKTYTVFTGKSQEEFSADIFAETSEYT